jgi:hypothetical protein
VECFSLSRRFIGHTYGILCRQRKMFPGLKPWATGSAMPNGIFYSAKKEPVLSLKEKRAAKAAKKKTRS